MNFNKRITALMAIDLMSFVCGGIVALFMISTIGTVRNTMYAVVAIEAVLNVAGMWAFGTYRTIWRYATLLDFIKCFVGIIVGTALTALVSLTLEHFGELLFCLLFFISICAVTATRTVYRYLVVRNYKDNDIKTIRTMIVGGGDTGRRLIQEMEDPHCSYKAVVIADDDPAKLFREVMGVKIAGTTEMIPQMVKEYNIDNIIFAIPSASKDTQKRIVNICSKTGCKVKVLPYLHELIVETSLLSQTREINVTDLLGRDEIHFDEMKNRKLIEGRVCMVTGGGGSIGSELSRQIATHHPKQLIIVDIYENNAYDIQQELKRIYGDRLDLEVRIASVRDEHKMSALFDEFRPELVFHAAAHKHVPLMEDSPEEAIKNNIFGTFNTAKLSAKYGVKKFVLVSTDKAVNPTNVMGATKRCCEMIIEYMSQMKKGTEFVAVRFGNVLGSNGSVIPLFRRQIEEGGPVTVTHPDIIRYFMTIPEAVSLILQAASFAHGGEIFVLDMGKPVKITTLAENLIRLMGMEPGVDIKIEFTGLRPGEKLFEELLMDEEGLKKTENDKIFIGRQIEIDTTEFMEKLGVLEAAARSDVSQRAIEELHNIVPTFKRNGD